MAPERSSRLGAPNGCASIGRRVCFQMSQLTVSATLAPLAKASAPLIAVGTSTSMTSPRLGSLVTVRVAKAREALAKAVALDPTFAKDPRSAFRLHHIPESLIDQFVASLGKAGPKDPAV